jgi:hypothetical protein
MRVLVPFLFLLAGAVSSAFAQDSVVTGPDTVPAPAVKLYRNPKVAQALGFVPGWGHIYSGEYLRGYAAWVATIGGVGLGPLVFQMNRCSLALFALDCKPGPTWPYKALGAYMTVMGLWTWYSTARDAPHAAERANARHARSQIKVAPTLDHSGASGGEWRGGLSVSW